MRAVVVDDELLARKRILNLLSQVPQIEVLGEYSNGKSAITAINSLVPELLFLDISMKDMNGFEVLKKLDVSPRPIVIFVTAYDDYAIRAFDADATDFLLKPFRDERFFKTIDKVLKTSTAEAQLRFENRMQELLELYSDGTKKPEPRKKLPVKQGNKIILLVPEKIYYITASGYYAQIFVEKRKYLLRDSLNNLLRFFGKERFFRIHRSVIVNLEYVEEIISSSFGEMDVRMKDGQLFRVSRAQKKDFFKKIGI